MSATHICSLVHQRALIYAVFCTSEGTYQVPLILVFYFDSKTFCPRYKLLTTRSLKTNILHEGRMLAWHHAVRCVVGGGGGWVLRYNTSYWGYELLVDVHAWIHNQPATHPPAHITNNDIDNCQCSLGVGGVGGTT